MVHQKNQKQIMVEYGLHIWHLEVTKRLNGVNGMTIIGFMDTNN